MTQDRTENRTQDCATGAHIAVAEAARTNDSPAVHGAKVARLPAGYDRTDLKMLEWIAAHRRPARAKISGLAA